MKRKSHVRFGERGGETRWPSDQKVRSAPTLRHRRHAHLGARRGQAQRRRAPDAAAVRAGAQPHDRLDRADEPCAARHRGLCHRARRHLGAARLYDLDRLRTFDIVLANPPYSIKQWNREAWQSDPWGRNFLGTPPQGRADYAFFQHILASLDRSTGAAPSSSRTACSFAKKKPRCGASSSRPTWSNACLGSGPTSSTTRPWKRASSSAAAARRPSGKGRILFIDAVNEVARERAQSFLKPEHQQRILAAYRAFADKPGFARAATQEEIARQEYSLSIPLYVKRVRSGVQAANGSGEPSLADLWAEWEQDGREFWQQMDELIEMLDGLMIETTTTE